MESQKNLGTFTSQGHFSSPQMERIQSVTVGCPTEIFNGENRVGMTPEAAREIISNNHKVLIQSGAGLNSGYTDEQYKSFGCTIVNSAQEVYSQSQIIVKVMAPMQSESQYLQKNQIIMGFWNTWLNGQNNTQNNIQNNSQFQNSEWYQQQKQMTEVLQKNNITFVDYNNIENGQGYRSVGQPMSEILGQMGVQQAMKYLEKQMGGSGSFLGSVTGASPSRVTVLGSGVVGLSAARFASSIGAQVTVMDINMENLHHVRQNLSGNVTPMLLTQNNLEQQLQNTNVLIGAVFPQNFSESRFIVSKNQMKMMKKGSVVVDLAMWSGGNLESSRPTTMDQPTFNYENIVHICATNMWSSVPQLSSSSLSSSSLQFVLQLANRGWQNAVLENNSLMNGIIYALGESTNQNFSRFYQLSYKPVEQLLKDNIQKISNQPQDLMTLKLQLGQFQRQMNRDHFTIEA